MPRCKQGEHIVVFVTAVSLSEARKIACHLVKNGIAACVNIVPGIESIFVWQEKLNTVKETLLIIKTKKSHFQKLKKEVKKMHSYQVPEIIAFLITDGDDNYLNWINKALK